MTLKVTLTSTTAITTVNYPIPGPHHVMHHLKTRITDATTTQPPAIASQFKVQQPRTHDSDSTQKAVLAYLKHTGQAYNDQQSLVEQVAHHLHAQIESLQQAHGQLSQELKNMLPTGIVHLLLTNFAQMLYTDKWEPEGKKVIRSLLITHKLERYLPEEHVAQILALLQHDLSASLNRVTAVHPSMERLIYATLNLNYRMPLKPYHICQALLCALLSYANQKEPNCYIIASIPYLISNHPTHFLDHLYRLLQRGCVYVNSLRVDLTVFFPMLAIVEDIEHPTPISKFLASPVIKQALDAHCVQKDFSSFPAQTPLKLLGNCATSHAQYEELCRYLRGIKEDLLIQLFILTTELKYINHESVYCQKMLEMIKNKLTRLMCHLPDAMAQQIASDVMKSLMLLAPQEAYLQSCIPSNTDGLGKDAALYKRLCQESILICSYRGGQLKIHHSLSGLITYLNERMFRTYNVYKRSNPHLSPPRSVSYHVIPAELAALFTSYYPDISQAEKQQIAKACTQLDSCLLPSPGGDVLKILTHIAPSYGYVRHQSHTKTAEQFAVSLNRDLFSHFPRGTPPCFILEFKDHCFTMHPTPTLLLPPSQFRKKLDQLQAMGNHVLSQRVMAADVIACTNLCYPDQAEAARILSRLDSRPITTFRDLRDTLLRIINREDSFRIRQQFNCYLSSYVPDEIPFETVLKELKISLTTDEVCQQFQCEAKNNPQHPYHIGSTLRNILISNGHHVAIEDIQQALQKAALKEHIKIGDLNYIDSNHQGQNTSHSHLLIEFNYTTEKLGFFQAAPKEIRRMPKQLVEYCRLVFPKHLPQPTSTVYTRI